MFTKSSTSDGGQLIKEEEDGATVLDLSTKGIESTSDGGQIIKEEEDGATVLDLWGFRGKMEAIFSYIRFLGARPANCGINQLFSSRVGGPPACL